MTYNIHEAKTQLSALRARVEAGETVTIARKGRPIDDPVAVSPPERTFGRMSFSVPDDFDEPLPDG